MSTSFGTRIQLEERDIIYSLAQIRGVGRKTVYELYECCGSFFMLLERTACILSQVRMPAQVKKAVKERMTTGQVLADKQKRLASDVRFLSFLDEQFPRLLKEIVDPPAILFYRGDPGLLTRPMLGVVGTRKPTAYGKAVCRHLTDGLARAGFVIVSGLAQGIDTEAHRAALEAGGGTVGVLACGLDQVYPRHNRPLYREIARSGLLLSEYVPAESPKPGMFPERNRLISGLSLGVLIIEAAERSGSLITADYALDQGRDVFAVPGPIFSPVSAGPHNLLQQGAKLITNPVDIIEEYPQYAGIVGQSAPSAAALNEPERLIMSLVGYEPIHWEELYAGLDADVGRELDRHLLHLETQGLLEALPGGYYVKRRDG
ncbi:MAG: DNA-protecting protein DprA [Brevibacillus sp.]|nr:DNA-protecting protein DprA [Brevibacillus sp.]